LLPVTKKLVTANSDNTKHPNRTNDRFDGVIDWPAILSKPNSSLCVHGLSDYPAGLSRIFEHKSAVLAM